MTTLKEAISNDERVRRTLSRLKREELLDLDAVEKEIFSLHSTRGIRALKVGAILQSSAHVLVESAADEVAVRSRAIEIKMHALAESENRKEAITGLTNYILSRYSRPLTKRFSRITERKTYVSTILSSASRRTNRLSYIMELCSLVEKDVDAAGWSTKLIGEVVVAAAKRAEKY